jgi:hypothetical protein
MGQPLSEVFGFRSNKIENHNFVNLLNFDKVCYKIIVFLGIEREINI